VDEAEGVAHKRSWNGINLHCRQYVHLFIHYLLLQITGLVVILRKSPYLVSQLVDLVLG
jgi:hypothetical protein